MNFDRHTDGQSPRVSRVHALAPVPVLMLNCVRTLRTFISCSASSSSSGLLYSKSLMRNSSSTWDIHSRISTKSFLRFNTFSWLSATRSWRCCNCTTHTHTHTLACTQRRYLNVMCRTPASLLPHLFAQSIPLSLFLVKLLLPPCGQARYCALLHGCYVHGHLFESRLHRLHLSHILLINRTEEQV